MSIGRIELVNGEKAYVRYATFGGGGKVEPEKPSYDPILENNSWETISAVSIAGFASEAWNLGDTKDGFTIIGFDHDTLADGSGKKAGITFMSPQQSEAYWKQGGSTNIFNYYDSSTIYSDTLPQIKSSLPEDISEVIRTVNKGIMTGSAKKITGGKDIQVDLFLPSVRELYSSYSNSIFTEGSIYEGVSEAIVPVPFTWTRTVYLDNPMGDFENEYGSGDNGNVYKSVTYFSGNSYQFDYTDAAVNTKGVFEYFFCV